MSPTTPSPFGTSPFTVHSIHFAFPGSPAIQLRDHVSNALLGDSPEWVSGSRNEPAAYPASSLASAQVVFRSSPGADGTYIVGATGSLGGVSEALMTLAFDPRTGLSAPVTLSIVQPMPNGIGVHSAVFEWYALESAETGTRLAAGNSSHTLYTTWRPPVPNLVQGLDNWVYQKLMEWTCQWASGQNDERHICDAIIRGLPTSGLRYGVRAHEVRSMLTKGGGMCSGWYKMFQHLCHSQGVFIHRRSFWVHWRELPKQEVNWCAIVIRAGGLNQPEPTHPVSEFNDNDAGFPPPAACALVTRTERRYRFWGRPRRIADGHCINFLEYQGKVYLYDACFGTGPVELDSPLPPDDYRVLGGSELASFKARYLDAAVDYMLGSVYRGDKLWKSTLPGAGGINGMTVRTALIPEMLGENSGLTFYWGG